MSEISGSSLPLEQDSPTDSILSGRLSDDGRLSDECFSDECFSDECFSDSCHGFCRQALSVLNEEPGNDPAEPASRLARLAEACAAAARQLAPAGRALVLYAPEPAPGLGERTAPEPAPAQTALLTAGDAAEPLLTRAENAWAALVSGNMAPVLPTDGAGVVSEGIAGAAEGVAVPLRLADVPAGILLFAATDKNMAETAIRVPADRRVTDTLIVLGDTFCTAWRALRRRQEQEAQLRQAETGRQTLEQANTERAQFLGVLSHELRNPATALIMGLSLLDIVAPDSPQGIRAREIMRNQTLLLVRLLDELQDVTRLERNNFVLNRQVIDLAHVAQGTILEMQEAFSEQDVVLQAELPEHPVRINGDAARLADLFRHLLDNALKASPAGSTVSFRLYPEPDAHRVTVEVLDHGRGIVPEDLPLLFQPFKLADHRFDRIRNGLGIGLAIVQGIAELHGGQVAAISAGPGQGARFTVRLPLTQPT